MEHKSGRCHPFPALHCDANGSKACLRCDAPALLPVAPIGMPADVGCLPAMSVGADAAPERAAGATNSSMGGTDVSSKRAPEDGCLILEELQDKKVWQAKGVEATRREEYLSDYDFQALFGMSKADFAKFPKWRRDSEKKIHGLF